MRELNRKKAQNEVLVKHDNNATIIHRELKINEKLSSKKKKSTKSSPKHRAAKRKRSPKSQQDDDDEEDSSDGDHTNDDGYYDYRTDEWIEDSEDDIVEPIPDTDEEWRDFNKDGAASQKRIKKHGLKGCIRKI